jgi:uncharacterized protein YceK
MFIVTSDVFLMITDTCKLALAAIIVCAVTSGCLSVVDPISPVGQKSRN